MAKIISSDLAHQEERSIRKVLRFIGNLKSRITNTGELRKNDIYIEENENSNILWLRYEQHFIRKEEHFSKVKNLLNLIEDDKGLLRLKTRLSNHPTLNYNVMHPILLQTDSYFTTLVINYYHEENYHNGVNSTLNLVRQNFWIRTGRQRFKKVLKKCFICNYIQKHPLNPTEVAALPSFRVSCEHAFENVGVDFVGPLYYKVSNNEMKKCYILLFTCVVSRVTHLELTTDVGIYPLS